jgi:hypothetical protein
MEYGLMAFVNAISMKYMHWWMWLMVLSVMRHIKKSSYQTTYAKSGQINLTYVMSHLDLCGVDALVICPPFWV